MEDVMSVFTTDSSAHRTGIATTVVSGHLNSDLFVNDAARDTIILVVSLVLSPIISFVGISTNLINIIVFIKSGFTDSVNITLLWLSISDLCLVLVTLWQNVCAIPDFQHADLPFDPTGTGYVTGGFPLTYFCRTTSWITVFITIERYLCVAFPLKVKTLSTPRRTSVITATVYLLMAGTMVPLFYTSRLQMVVFPGTNITRLGLVFTPDRYEIAKFTNPIMNVLVQILSFLLVLIFTILLVTTLSRKNKWRENTTDKAMLLSRRDQKVARMIVLISSNFIVCYTILAIEYILPMFVSDFTSGPVYRNLFFIMTSFAIMTLEINTSVNLFIYLAMSTKYKKVFKSLCLRCGKTPSM